MEPDRRPFRDRAAHNAAARRLGSLDRDTEQALAAQVESDGSAIDLASAITLLRADEIVRGDLARLRALSRRLRESTGDPEAAADALDAAVAAETAEDPVEEVRRRLWNRTPDFVMFDDRQRELASEYDLEEVIRRPPIPLANLARLAELDLAEMLKAAKNAESGTIEYFEREANRRLAQFFGAWRQEPSIAVTLRLSGTLLQIHVTTGADVPMRLDERSDGLREFVALVAATAQTAQIVASIPPVLLIDEIETHLHYDAQGDLLRILASQIEGTGDGPGPVNQVIYTTHSAACLPDDLGSIRVVEASPERMRSRIRNQFWTDRPGLGPLLMAMGAASLAFVPRRPALVTEGPSELILLATLIKQTIGSEHLGYQVAPGASAARPGTIIGFDLEAPSTVWLVDGDDGGAKIRRKLLEDGIDPACIVTLADYEAGLMLEDLIEQETYCDAVNAYLADKGCHDDPIRVEALSTHRPNAVLAHCEAVGVSAPSKVVIANRLLSMRSERRLVAPSYRSTLRALHREVSRLLRRQ